MFSPGKMMVYCVFFFQAEDGIRDGTVTGVQTCALPICVGAPLVEQLGAHLEERGLLRRRLGPGTRDVVPAGAVVLIGCLHGSLLRRKRASGIDQRT